MGGCTTALSGVLPGCWPRSPFVTRCHLAWGQGCSRHWPPRFLRVEGVFCPVCLAPRCTPFLPLGSALSTQDWGFGERGRGAVAGPCPSSWGSVKGGRGRGALLLGPGPFSGSCGTFPCSGNAHLSPTSAPAYPRGTSLL